MVFQAAGATTLSTPSNELYAAMQTGACDAATTSSTSLISFRLEEVAKSLTTGRGKSYWFMLEPLIMSKQIFDAMPKDQRDIIMALGEELEKFGTKEAMADDQKVAEVYAKKGAKVADLDEAIVEKWRVIARDTAWKDYAKKTPLSAELLKLAERDHRLLSMRRTSRSGRHVSESGPQCCTASTSARRREAHGSRRRRVEPAPPELPPADSRARRSTAHRGAVVGRAGHRGARAHLQRRQPLLPASLDRLAGRAVGVPDRRRRLHVGGGDPGAARPYRHRGDRRPAAAAGEPLARSSRSMSRASLFCAFFAWKSWTAARRGAGPRTSTRTRPGDRRCGFPIR